MKSLYKQLFASTVALAMFTSSASVAFATNDGDKRNDTTIKGSITLNGGIKVDDKLWDRWKDWSYDPAVVGTVTAKTDTTLTIKAGNSGTIYVVDASNAKVRRGNDDISFSSISVNDAVVIQGAISGNTIVATSIVTAKAGTVTKPMPNDMSGIIGTITATSDTSITIVGKNGTTYTVMTADASIWKDKNSKGGMDDLDVGDSVIIQGKVNGTSVTATNVVEVNLPQEMAHAGIRGTVTAKTVNSLTVLVSDGTSYQVDTSEVVGDEDKDDIKVGESVVVRGTVSGTSVDATSVDEVRASKGIFTRIGSFFRHFFKGDWSR